MSARRLLRAPLSQAGYLSSVAAQPAAAPAMFSAQQQHQQHQQQSGSASGSAFAAVMALGMSATVGFAAENKKEEVDYDAVRKAIADMLDNDAHDDGSYGPLFVRLAWHAAGTYDKVTKTGGSNGATMRFPVEANDGANAGLGLARDLLEPIKKKFPGITYADLWTLAGAVAIEEMGGPKIKWRPGRSDASDASTVPPNGRLPDAAQGAQHMRDVFYRMGFNDREITALVGAHTLGRCHPDRSGFSGPWTRAPTTFSNQFFVELTKNTWREKKWSGPKQYEDVSGDLMMLPADMAFLSDKEFRKWVDKYAEDADAFSKDFAAAFSKLLELGVPFPKSGWRRFWPF